MTDKRPLIVTGLVLLLIIALIGGVIFYLINFIKGRQTQEASSDIFPKTSMNVVVVTPTPSGLVAASPNPPSTPAAQQSVVGTSSDGNSKTYTGQGFQLTFPKTWGVTTCSNTKHFELDPYNSSDQTIVCSRATKPITVLVGQSSCVGGETAMLGNTQVAKNKDNSFRTRDGNGVQYHWCTKSGVSLDITHRVGSGTAFAQDDYSKAVEQMISTLTTSGS